MGAYDPDGPPISSPRFTTQRPIGSGSWDLECMPSTHRKDLAQTLQEIEEASTAAVTERWGRLSMPSPSNDSWGCVQGERCSLDWRVYHHSLPSDPGDRPGRASVSAFVRPHLGPRRRAAGNQHDGTVVVARWINLECYFSPVNLRV